ncbi:hypothetical protein [Allocoleopsis sp.]
MKRRLLSSIFITACLWAIANLSEHQPRVQSGVKLSITTATNLFHLRSHE